MAAVWANVDSPIFKGSAKAVQVKLLRTSSKPKPGQQLFHRRMHAPHEKSRKGVQEAKLGTGSRAQHAASTGTYANAIPPGKYGLLGPGAALHSKKVLWLIRMGIVLSRCL